MQFYTTRSAASLSPTEKEELRQTLSNLLAKIMKKEPTIEELSDSRTILQYAEAIALLLLSMYQKELMDVIEVWKLFPRFDMSKLECSYCFC